VRQWLLFLGSGPMSSVYRCNIPKKYERQKLLIFSSSTSCYGVTFRILTNQLTPSNRVLQKLMVTQLVKKFPFMEPEGSLPSLQKSRHWSLSWARCIHCKPSHPISIRPIQILSSHLRLDLPNSLPFTSSFRDQHSVCISRLSHACYILSWVFVFFVVVYFF